MSDPNATPANPPVPPEESLLKFPADFPIKVMGVHHADFVTAVVAIVQTHAPAFDPTTLVHLPSSGGKYLGLTVTVTVHSREQLDNIYRGLTSHPLIKYVL